MNSNGQDIFASLLWSLRNARESHEVSLKFLLTFGLAVLIVGFVAWRSGSGNPRCHDIDGLPIKELRVGGYSRAAMVFQPHKISKQGQELAHDDPFVLCNGGYREVVLHTAEHVREFLRNDSKDHYKPAGMNFGDYFDRLLGQCVGALHGRPWRSVRRYFDQSYTHEASLSLIPLFEKEATKWLTGLKNDALRAGVGRMVVNGPTSCKVLPLRAIPISLYGNAYDDKVHAKLVQISTMQRQALVYVITGQWQMFSLFNALPTPSRLHLNRYHAEWKKFNLEILESARQRGISIPAEHVFQGVQPDQAMSMDQYLQTIDEMIFTNIDITGNVMAFMLEKLAQHPDFQERLYEEIMTQKQSVAGFRLTEYVSRQTTLLHYLCMESIRLRPAIWFSAPECTTVDKVIGRYKIPSHTHCVIDVRRLNTNALTWGVDASQFRPERFASLSPNEYRYGYMRFGIGSGKCLGKHMADALMKVVMVTILEQYKIEEIPKSIGVKEGDLSFIRR